MGLDCRIRQQFDDRKPNFNGKIFWVERFAFITSHSKCAFISHNGKFCFKPEDTKKIKKIKIRGGYGSFFFSFFKIELR